MRLAVGREPAPADVTRGVEFMTRLREQHNASPDVALDQFCLMVLNLNEFVYLD